MATFTVESYVTPTEAQTYIDTVLDATAWDEATFKEQQKALTMATRAIDRLDFQGEKADEDQSQQFPRGEDTDVPADICSACVELALRLLDGVDIDLEDEGLRIKAQGYASARITYDSEFTPEHVRAGIPSKRAWAFLKPYLRDLEQLDLARVD